VPPPPHHWRRIQVGRPSKSGSMDWHHPFRSSKVVRLEPISHPTRAKVNKSSLQVTPNFHKREYKCFQKCPGRNPRFVRHNHEAEPRVDDGFRRFRGCNRKLSVRMITARDTEHGAPAERAFYRHGRPLLNSHPSRAPAPPPNASYPAVYCPPC